MNENQEATLLAAWLSNEPGGPAPIGIDQDVMETIYALRPEYAPPLQLSIEEVFDGLMDGPLLDPAVGKALQTWLNSPPGTAPPSTLPIGVVEAAYALRPDLAPAVQFGIEDILEEVKAGPLATKTLVDIESARPGRAWWSSPALGAVAVAAIALFFVGPLAHKADKPAIVVPQMARTSGAEAQPAVAKTLDVEFEADGDSVDKHEELPAQPSFNSTPISPPQTENIPPSSAFSAPKRTARIHTAPVPPSASQPSATQQESTAMVDRKSDDVADNAYGSAPSAESGPSMANPNATAAEPSLRSQRMEEKTRSVRDDRESTRSDNDSPIATSARERAPRTNARPLRLHPNIATLEQQSEKALKEARYDDALRAIEAALSISERTRFDTARLWRTKAKILTLMGRETDAQVARETAAQMDPTR